MTRPRKTLFERMSEASHFAVVPDEGWKPIGTAPKDGRDLLLYSPDACEPKVMIGGWVEFEDGIAEWSDAWTGTNIYAEPSHWRPLPEPPVSQ